MRKWRGWLSSIGLSRVGADGRSRATVNGSMASMGELAQIVGPTIDLCGQFEHQQLMKPATHVRMLDAWVGEAADALGCVPGRFRRCA